MNKVEALIPREERPWPQSLSNCGLMKARAKLIRRLARVEDEIERRIECQKPRTQSRQWPRR
jgi:hypothetical protein